MFSDSKGIFIEYEFNRLLALRKKSEFLINIDGILKPFRFTLKLFDFTMADLLLMFTFPRGVM